MMGNYWGGFSNGGWNFFGGGFMPFGGGFFLAIFVLWSLFWKGMALWKAAHENSRPWFIALLVINTGGILDLLYLYVFSKKSESTVQHHEHHQSHEHHRKS